MVMSAQTLFRKVGGATAEAGCSNKGEGSEGAARRKARLCEYRYVVTGDRVKRTASRSSKRR